MRSIIPKGSQVFTPAPLASAMVSALKLTRPHTWLEPSFGGGVFLDAIAGSEEFSESVTGLELDTKLARGASPNETVVVGVDALEWMNSTKYRFDAVVGNPPYASLSDVGPSMQRSACAVSDPAGNRLRPSSNAWVAFVMASVWVLRDGGAMSFVLPASWDYADYAGALRRELPLMFETFHVYRSEKPLFSGVSEGSVVVLGTGFRRRHRYRARVVCADLKGVCAALSDFHPAERRDLAERFEEAPIEAKYQRLADFLNIRLGGVTGDANYFTISEERRIALGLPASSLRKIVSRAKHLKWPSIGESEWKELRDSGEKIWLFRPTPASIEIPSVKSYLKRTLADGGCNRASFKVENRRPWYLTPLPTQVDAFVSGMTSFGPRLTFRQLDGLSATNTLYVVSFAKDLNIGRRRNIALQLISDNVLSQLERVQRTYAGGLRKLEPGDILRLRVEPPERSVGAREYHSAFRLRT